MLRKVSYLFILFVLFTATAMAQSADEIIAKNLEARGGKDKISAIKTVKFTGKLIVPSQGLEAPVLQQTKRPSSVRLSIDIQGKSFVQAYDGQTGWQLNPFSGSPDAQKMSEEETNEIKSQADFEGLFVNYKEKGNTVELLGKEDLEGSPVYKLKVTEKSGDTTVYYFDADSYLEIKNTSKTKVQGTEIEIDTFSADYKEVNGVLFPHTYEQKVKGTVTTQITISKIETNIEIEDSLFKMPSK